MRVQYTGHVIETETRDHEIYEKINDIYTKLYKYEISYTFDTVLYQFLETGTSDITFMGRDQELN